MRVRAQAKGRLGRGDNGLEVVNTKDRPAKVREGRGPRPSPCLSGQTDRGQWAFH